MGNVKNKQKRGEEMSVFYRDIDVKISNYKSELSKPLVVFERDRGLEIYFNLIEYAYRFDKSPTNLLENLVGAYATVTLVNPSGDEIRVNEVEITEEAKVKFIITEDLTDELTEIGTYQLQIHVNNDTEGRDTSVFSIPPFNFEVRERLKGRKNQLLDSEGYGLIDKEGYQLMSASSSKVINFPANKINEYLGSIPAMQGKIKDLNSQLEHKSNKNRESFINSKSYGIVSDSISFNSNIKKYTYTNDYKDKLTELINNEPCVYLEKGDYYISGSIEVDKEVTIISDGANIYIDPVYNTNIGAFSINADNVSITGVNIISEEVYAPKIGSNDTTGKTSNVYAFWVKSSNVNISSCSSTNCFALTYLNSPEGYAESNIIANINVYNCIGNNVCFGLHCYYVDNVNFRDIKLHMSESGMNDFCHLIYVGSTSSNVAFDNIKLTGGTYTLYDSISLHDSVSNRKTIYNITFNNVNSTAKSRNFITLSDCDTVVFDNCNYVDMTLDQQKGWVATQKEVRNVTIKNCKIKLHQGYSLINSSDGGENVSSFEVYNCIFDLRDTNTYIFRHMRSARIVKCVFNITSSSERRLSFFCSDSAQIKHEKNIQFIDCVIVGDANTCVDNLLICNSDIDDIILIDKCDIINKYRDDRVIDLQKNYGNVIVVNSNFYGYNEIHDSLKSLNKFNVNFV